MYGSVEHGGHPSEDLEASLDIIDNRPAADVAPTLTAEAILCSTAAIGRIIGSNAGGGDGGGYQIRLGHAHLGQRLLELCGVTPAQLSRDFVRTFSKAMRTGLTEEEEVPHMRARALPFVMSNSSEHSDLMHWAVDATPGIGTSTINAQARPTHTGLSGGTADCCRRNKTLGARWGLPRSAQVHCASVCVRACVCCVILCLFCVLVHN